MKWKNWLSGIFGIKKPILIAHIEPNERLGRGFQARFTADGKLLELRDASPYTLNEAIEGATLAIQETNRYLPVTYNPKKCIRISRIEGNTDG